MAQQLAWRGIRKMHDYKPPKPAISKVAQYQKLTESGTNQRRAKVLSMALAMLQADPSYAGAFSPQAVMEKVASLPIKEVNIAKMQETAAKRTAKALANAPEKLKNLKQFSSQQMLNITSDHKANFDRAIQQSMYLAKTLGGLGMSDNGIISFGKLNEKGTAVLQLSKPVLRKLGVTIGQNVLTNPFLKVLLAYNKFIKALNGVHYFNKRQPDLEGESRKLLGSAWNKIMSFEKDPPPLDWVGSKLGIKWTAQRTRDLQMFGNAQPGQLQSDKVKIFAPAIEQSYWNQLAQQQAQPIEKLMEVEEQPTLVNPQEQQKAQLKALQQQKKMKTLQKQLGT